MIEYKRLTAGDVAITKKLVRIFRNQIPSDEKVLLPLTIQPSTYMSHSLRRMSAVM